MSRLVACLWCWQVISSSCRPSHQRLSLLLKRKIYQAQSCFSNELHDALINKDFTQFWRSWNAKFGHRPQAQVITSYSDCEWCTQVGVWKERWAILTLMPHAVQTSLLFLWLANSNHHGASPLADSQLCIGMVSEFVLDYMHLICLGVVLVLSGCC